MAVVSFVAHIFQKTVFLINEGISTGQACRQFPTGIKKTKAWWSCGDRSDTKRKKLKSYPGGRREETTSLVLKLTAPKLQQSSTLSPLANFNLIFYTDIFVVELPPACECSSVDKHGVRSFAQIVIASCRDDILIISCLLFSACY